MKKINVRFVERCSKEGEIKDYLIQRKTLFGWKYITWTCDMGYGAVVYMYCKNNKKELLDEVLDKYYKVGEKYVSVTEYPSLKTY